jgi:hypothetical protein
MTRRGPPKACGHALRHASRPRECLREGDWTDMRGLVITGVILSRELSAVVHEMHAVGTDAQLC